MARKMNVETICDIYIPGGANRIQRVIVQNSSFQRTCLNCRKKIRSEITVRVISKFSDKYQNCRTFCLECYAKDPLMEKLANILQKECQLIRNQESGKLPYWKEKIAQKYQGYLKFWSDVKSNH